MAELNAELVKRRAKELGADLVGIASAATLNAFPPDPRWPQTPERISPYCKSVIVLVQRIPAGAFRCKTNAPVQYIDMLVLRKMDKVAYRLAEELEDAGHPSFVTAAQETDWSYKRASYGRLSTRHLGVEAGLGTLGLEVNILTPEFGPRVYLTGILTELELEPDRPLTEQVCIGELCSRCLHACPADAVLHFGIDKRACATEAQEFGFSTILQFFERFIDAPPRRRRRWRARATFTASGRDCCASSARSATVRAASPCARSATTITPISPTRRSNSGKDAGEGRARQELSRQPRAGRRHRRPQRLEQALGRARRLPRHGGAAAAGIQESAAAAQQGRSGRSRRQRAALNMVAVFKQPLTAAEIKAKARARARSGGSPTARRSSKIRRTRAIRDVPPTSPTWTPAASSCWPSA